MAKERFKDQRSLPGEECAESVSSPDKKPELVSLLPAHVSGLSTARLGVTGPGRASITGRRSLLVYLILGVMTGIFMMLKHAESLCKLSPFVVRFCVCAISPHRFCDNETVPIPLNMNWLFKGSAVFQHGIEIMSLLIRRINMHVRLKQRKAGE